MADISVDKGALSDYASKASKLASEIGDVGTTGLADAQSVPDDCFGDVGRESGLPAKITSVCHSLTTSVGQVASGLSGLSSAVSKALTDYEHMDEQTAQNFDKTAN